MLRHKTSIEYFENWFSNKPPIPTILNITETAKEKFATDLI